MFFGKKHNTVLFVSQLVQSLSRVRLFVTPWTAACQASLSITSSQSLLKLMFIESAIQPSHPLLSPSPPALNPSQHQGLFKWVSSSHQMAKVLEFQLQHQSLQWTPRTDLLWDGLVGSPCSPRESQESSPTPQCKSINSSVLSFLYSPTLTSIYDHWKNHSLDYTTFVDKIMSFHHRGLECKSRKSGDNQSYRQVWPWSTKWSRTKTKRILPREHTGHSKHPLSITRE